ncbi:hypothetical protein [Bacillus sp. AR18-7]|uniref:hypothetical protein n=1 Tax=Bacillus sp. AR18-7 TaxID=2217821 RepID=UPI0015D12DA2|nr:hypothetical protein [Bacillus sp. AR18-7]
MLKKMFIGMLATGLITGWTGDTHLNKIKKEADDIQKSVPQVVDNLTNLKQKFDELSRNANEKIGQANQIIENKVGYINHLHQKLDEAANQINKEQARAKQMETNNSHLHSENQRLQSELASEKQKLSDALNTKETLQKQIDEKAKKLGEVENTVAQLQQNKTELEREQRSLTTQLEQQKQELTKKQNETKGLQEKITTLEGQLEQKKQELKAKETSIQTLTKQKTDLEAEKKNLESKLVTATNTENKLKKEIEELQLYKWKLIGLENIKTNILKVINDHPPIRGKLNYKIDLSSNPQYKGRMFKFKIFNPDNVIRDMKIKIRTNIDTNAGLEQYFYNIIYPGEYTFYIAVENYITNVDLAFHENCYGYNIELLEGASTFEAMQEAVKEDFRKNYVLRELKNPVVNWRGKLYSYRRKI